MFVPIASPIINNHYHIVYADTVLSLKEIGSNIHVASISGVIESEMEECIKVITSANKEVTFNTIQYSKNNNKIYFYTDKPISVSEWKESKIKYREGVKNIDAIIEEAKALINEETSLNTGYISLYDLNEILRSYNVRDDSKVDLLKYKLDWDISDKFGNGALICLHKFDYTKNAISVSFKRYSTSEFKEILITKVNDDLRVLSSESLYDKEVFEASYQTFNECFDYFQKVRDYETESKHGVRILNSRFKAYISKYGVELSKGSELEINLYAYNPDISVTCNSGKVQQVLSQNKVELLKHAYVKIDDCPSWVKEDAIEFRIKQVKEQIKEMNKRDFWERINIFKRNKNKKKR